MRCRYGLFRLDEREGRRCWMSTPAIPFQQVGAGTADDLSIAAHPRSSKQARARGVGIKHQSLGQSVGRFTPFPAARDGGSVRSGRTARDASTSRASDITKPEFVEWNSAAADAGRRLDLWDEHACMHAWSSIQFSQSSSPFSRSAGRSVGWIGRSESGFVAQIRNDRVGVCCARC